MFKSPWRSVVTFTMGLTLLVVGTICAQQFTQSPDDKKAAQLVCQMVHRYHISQKKINDEVSKKTLKRYLETVDPLKLYFLQADIDELNKSETLLDDQLLAGDVSFGYNVFKLYLQRVAERLTRVGRWIHAEHDFSADESRLVDRDAILWARTSEELDERWRKRVKAELLAKKLDGTKLEDARKQLVKRYNNVGRNEKQTDSSEILQRYLSAMTHSFDPHSSYMSPQTREDFDISMRLQLQGIGAALRNEEGFTTVAQIVPGGAAHKDGRLKVGDKIIGVAQDAGEFEDIVEMKLTRVVRLIRGKAGTKVRLRIKLADSGDTKVYELTRQVIELKESAVSAKIIDTAKRTGGRQGRIGIIRLPSFYRDFDAERRGVENFRSAARDVRKALEGFNTDGNVDAVVIDLRTNGGGALKDAIEVSGLFIDQGPVVRVKELDGSITPHRDRDPGTAFSGPVVLITSRMSASASEIFAGAIKDYHRGLLVGDLTTHGKGTVQNVMPVSSGPILNFFNRKPPGALKLTIQQFYRVNGESSQERGIPSDVHLPSIVDHMDFGESSLENHLPFDKIPAANFAPVGMINEKIIEVIQTRSQARVAKHAEFAKDRVAIERFKLRKDRKTVSLNEAVLKKELDENKDDEDAADDKPAPAIPPVFRDDHYNNEVLQITLDYIEQLKQARLIGN